MDSTFYDMFAIVEVYASMVWDWIPVKTREWWVGCLVVSKLGKQIDQYSASKDLAEIPFIQELIRRGQCRAFYILKDEHEAWDIAIDAMFELVGHKTMKMSPTSNQLPPESQIDEMVSIRQDFFRKLEHDYLTRVRISADRQFAKQQQLNTMIISLEELGHDCQ